MIYDENIYEIIFSLPCTYSNYIIICITNTTLKAIYPIMTSILNNFIASDWRFRDRCGVYRRERCHF